MEQGFQAFSKETVLSVFTLSSVKEEFLVMFVFALQCCALLSAVVSMWLCFAKYSAFYPSPIIPVISIH